MADQSTVTLAEIERAQSVLEPLVHRTPLSRAAALDDLVGPSVYLKLENLQLAGSFKVRGASYKIASLQEAEKSHGVVAASAGNHAQGVARAARETGISATIVMPKQAPVYKVEATERYGAQVVLHGDSYDDAYQRALQIQAETKATFIHAFDDPAVIAGQGTIALEILRDLPDVETVVVPIGGGGLISGIATAIKALRPRTRVVGVQAVGASAAYLSRQSGEHRATETALTIADGIAVKRPGDLTWQIMQGLVDDIVVVTEEEICHAILMLLERCKVAAEGAGAVPLAALLSGKVKAEGPTCALVSGGNIDMNILARMMERGLVESARYAQISALVPDKPGSLKLLLEAVAEVGANILEVHHNRWLHRVTISDAAVALSLEIRSRRHLNELLVHLREKGFAAREIPALSPTSDW